MTNNEPAAVTLATLIHTAGAEESLEHLRSGIAEAQEELRVIRFRIRALAGAAACSKHDPELIEAREQAARTIERRRLLAKRLLAKRLRAYVDHDLNILHADVGLACTNCGAPLCLREAIDGCYNCNHGVLDTTCSNHGDGHCRCCGQCK